MITIKQAEEILKKEYHIDNYLYIVNDILLPDFVSDFHEVDFNNTLFASVKQLGYSVNCEVSIFEVALNEGAEKRRVAITQEMFRILRGIGVNNALVAFVNADYRNYRFSLLTSKYEFEGDKIVKVLSNPRRYSYSLGYNTKTKTAYDYLIGKGKVNSLDELIHRFSVEVVNKNFYNEIANYFTRLVGNDNEVSNELEIYGVTDKNKYVEFAVRLIGRIVFCWFLKEKKSEDGIPLVPERMLSTNCVDISTNYYHDVLELLFFELLNNDPKRRKEQFVNNHMYEQIPYLNGGLFAPQTDDRYKYSAETETAVYGQVNIPNKWFSDFFTVLSEYNFTVDENTSYDIELSIDPEMLGRIFENLLAEITPETGENAKKSTGSFYTPREIVDYMVDNSLLEYLKTKTSIDEIKLKALISYSKEDDDLAVFDKSEKRKIIDALYTITVLDPACGSGAFPIGMLQKIVYILQEIDSDGSLWFDKATENISILMKREFEKKFNSGSLDYIRKLSVIQNSIFGVDIQPIAVEIARLRCFLSLVIEEKVIDNEYNRGVNPLPNLDFKFIIANTLVELPREGSSDQVTMLERQDHISRLKAVREEFFISNDSDTKNSLKLEFNEIQKEMYQEALDSNKMASAHYQALFQWSPFNNKPTSWFDPEWMFGVKDGFDIVIANPPYIKERDAKDVFSEINNTVWGKRWHQGKMDYWYYFLHKAIEITNSCGKIAFITPSYWMNSTGAKKLIRRINEELAISTFVNLGNIKTFENVSGYHMISIYDKSNVSDSFTYKNVYNLDGIRSETSTDFVEISTLKKSSVISPKYQIILAVNTIECNTDTLGDNYFVSQGVVEASDRISKNMYIKNPDPNFEIGNGVFVLSDFEVERLKLSSKEKCILRKYLDGKDVSRYKISYDEKYLIYSDRDNKFLIETDDDYLNIKLHLDKVSKYITSSNSPYGLHRPRQALKFEEPKIISPSMFKINQFAYDDNGFYVGMSFNVINQKFDSYPLKTLIGVLNSKFALFWFYNNGKHRGAGVDIGVDKLREFPLPKYQTEYINQIECLVDAIIHEKNNSNNTADIESKIDDLVYRMYGLSDQQIEDIEEMASKLYGEKR